MTASEKIPHDGPRKLHNRLIFPRLFSGQAWITTALHKVCGVGDDKEDEAQTAVDALAPCLSKIHEHFAHSSNAQTLSHHNTLSYPGEPPVHAKSIPHKHQMPQGAAICRDDPQGSYPPQMPLGLLMPCQPGLGLYVPDPPALGLRREW